MRKLLYYYYRAYCIFTYRNLQDLSSKNHIDKEIYVSMKWFVLRDIVLLDQNFKRNEKYIPLCY